MIKNRFYVRPGYPGTLVPVKGVKDVLLTDGIYSKYPANNILLNLRKSRILAVMSCNREMLNYAGWSSSYQASHDAFIALSNIFHTFPCSVIFFWKDVLFAIKKTGYVPIVGSIKSYFITDEINLSPMKQVPEFYRHVDRVLSYDKNVIVALKKYFYQMLEDEKIELPYLFQETLDEIMLSGSLLYLKHKGWSNFQFLIQNMGELYSCFYKDEDIIKSKTDKIIGRATRIFRKGGNILGYSM